MSRYIDANELIPLIRMGETNEYTELGEGRNGGIAFTIERIRQMPTADVVEVVRCKDCLWSENEPIDDDCDLWCMKHGSDVCANDYCSYGEKE